MKLFISIALLNYANYLSAQQLAFPGAEGYGKYASGGRGGRVVEVTNLMDYDPATETAIPGSFRAVVNDGKTDPITVIFRVSGIIQSKVRYLEVNRSNLTIAGQTAPGAGICFKGAKVKLSGNNIIIRYLRFRVGDELKISLSAVGTENFKRIIYDHCSMSWSVEENHTFYDNDSTTVQYCILSEGLYNSYNVKGERAYACQWGGKHASYHHNLIAHCNSRSPRFNGARSNDKFALVDFRNNVVFNWGGSGAIYGGELGILGGKCQTQMVNNYYKPGPATSGYYFVKPSAGTIGYGKWFVDGNVMEGKTNITINNWLGVNYSVGIDSIRSKARFTDFLIRTQSASDAFQTVIESTGASLPARDSVDLRIIDEIKGLRKIGGGVTFGTTSGIIDSPTEVGGWPVYTSTTAPTDSDHDGMPDDWENANGLNPEDANDGKIIATDGYSNLEHYLNSNDINIIYPKSIAFSTNDTIVDAEKGYVQLEATILPEDFDGDLKWNVSDTTIAVISDSGVLKPLKNGTVKVSVSFKEFEILPASKEFKIINKAVNPSSVSMHAETLLGIVPNPSNKFIQVLSNNKTEVTIFQTNGALMLKRVVNPNETISIEHLLPGIYVVQLSLGSLKHSVKLVKE